MSFFSRRKPTDVMYIEGIGDLVSALVKWHNKEDVLSETSITFSGQVFEFCKQNNLSLVGVAAHPEKKSIDFGQFSAFSKKKLMLKGGLGYHVSQLLYAMYLIKLAIQYRPKYFHITSGETHLFLLAPLKLLGVKVFPHIHNTFWATGYTSLSKSQHVLTSLDAWFFRKIASSVFCCSPEIKRQIETITKNRNCPVHVFKPQFHRENFTDATNADVTQKPFSVVFAGRVEEHKGVFDILTVAEHFKNDAIVFHICGDGTDLARLKSECKQLALEDKVHVHGRLERPDLLAIYNSGHVVIVPTRSDFPEGFAMVAAEAILLNRPIITSRIVPSLELLAEAAVEVEPENVNSYIDAIKLLMSDETQYKQKQAACSALKEQFLDKKAGLTKLLEKSLLY